MRETRRQRQRQIVRRRPGATVVISWQAAAHDPTVIALQRFEDEDAVFMERRAERRLPEKF